MVSDMSIQHDMKKGKDGNLVLNIEDRDYRSAHGLSKSMLTYFLRSPKHYLYATETTTEPTDAMQFGTAIDAEILRSNPKDFYAVCPDVDGRTKEGKLIKEKFKQEAEGKAVISAKDAEKIPFIKESLQGHPEVGKILRNLTHKQLAVFGTISTAHGDVVLKGLIDGYDEKTGTVFDLKTAQDASPEGFRRAMKSFSYHYQEIQYRWLLNNLGMPVDRFVFGVVDSAPPFVTGAYSMHDSLLKPTYDNWYRAIEKFAKCNGSGNWEGYGDSVITLTPNIYFE